VPFDPGVQVTVELVEEVEETLTPLGAVVLQEGQVQTRHQYFGTPPAPIPQTPSWEFIGQLFLHSQEQIFPGHEPPPPPAPQPEQLFSTLPGYTHLPAGQPALHVLSVSLNVGRLQTVPQLPPGQFAFEVHDWPALVPPRHCFLLTPHSQVAQSAEGFENGKKSAKRKTNEAITKAQFLFIYLLHTREDERRNQEWRAT